MLQDQEPIAIVQDSLAFVPPIVHDEAPQFLTFEVHDMRVLSPVDIHLLHVHLHVWRGCCARERALVPERTSDSLPVTPRSRGPVRTAGLLDTPVKLAKVSQELQDEPIKMLDESDVNTEQCFIFPDLVATVPDFIAIMPNSDTVVQSNHTEQGSIDTMPDSTAVVRESNAIVPDSNAIVPDSNAIVQDVILSDSIAIVPDSNAIVQPFVQGAVVDNSHTEQGSIFPRVTMPDSTAIVPDSFVTLPPIFRAAAAQSGVQSQPLSLDAELAGSGAELPSMEPSLPQRTRGPGGTSSRVGAEAEGGSGCGSADTHPYADPPGMVTFEPSGHAESSATCSDTGSVSDSDSDSYKHPYADPRHVSAWPTGQCESLHHSIRAEVVAHTVCGMQQVLEISRKVTQGTAIVFKAENGPFADKMCFILAPYDCAADELLTAFLWQDAAID